MHIGTFKFKTFVFELPLPPTTLLRWLSRLDLLMSGLRGSGTGFLGRRTCQTGLLLPKWTPGRAGLLGHFLDLDSPAELLREHGALLAFRVAGTNGLGRVAAFPADLLREKGHMLMLSSAEVVTPLFFSLSFLASVFFLSLFLKMSFQRLDAVAAEEEEEEESVIAGVGSGLFRRWRGRRTPLTMSWSAERMFGCGKEGFRTIQNSNSGEALGLIPLPEWLFVSIEMSARDHTRKKSVLKSYYNNQKRERRGWMSYF